MVITNHTKSNQIPNLSNPETTTKSFSQIPVPSSLINPPRSLYTSSSQNVPKQRSSSRHSNTSSAGSEKPDKPRKKLYSTVAAAGGKTSSKQHSKTRIVGSPSTRISSMRSRISPSDSSSSAGVQAALTGVSERFPAPRHQNLGDISEDTSRPRRFAITNPSQHSSKLTIIMPHTNKCNNLPFSESGRDSRVSTGKINPIVQRQLGDHIPRVTVSHMEEMRHENLEIATKQSQNSSTARSVSEFDLDTLVPRNNEQVCDHSQQDSGVAEKDLEKSAATSYNNNNQTNGGGWSVWDRVQQREQGSKQSSTLVLTKLIHFTCYYLTSDESDDFNPALTEALGQVTSGSWNRNQGEASNVWDRDWEQNTQIPAINTLPSDWEGEGGWNFMGKDTEMDPPEGNTGRRNSVSVNNTAKIEMNTEHVSGGFIIDVDADDYNESTLNQTITSQVQKGTGSIFEDHNFTPQKAVEKEFWEQTRIPPHMQDPSEQALEYGRVFALRKNLLSQKTYTSRNEKERRERTNQMVGLSSSQTRSGPSCKEVALPHRDPSLSTLNPPILAQLRRSRTDPLTGNPIPKSGQKELDNIFKGRKRSSAAPELRRRKLPFDGLGSRITIHEQSAVPPKRQRNAENLDSEVYSFETSSPVKPQWKGKGRATDGDEFIDHTERKGMFSLQLILYELVLNLFSKLDENIHQTNKNSRLNKGFTFGDQGEILPLQSQNPLSHVIGNPDSSLSSGSPIPIRIRPKDHIPTSNPSASTSYMGKQTRANNWRSTPFPTPRAINRQPQQNISPNNTRKDLQKSSLGRRSPKQNDLSSENYGPDTGRLDNNVNRGRYRQGGNGDDGYGRVDDEDGIKVRYGGGGIQDDGHGGGQEGGNDQYNGRQGGYNNQYDEGQGGEDDEDGEGGRGGNDGYDERQGGKKEDDDGGNDGYIGGQGSGDEDEEGGNARYNRGNGGEEEDDEGGNDGYDQGNGGEEEDDKGGNDRYDGGHENVWESEKRIQLQQKGKPKKKL
ncbi:hypothetical protein MJO28_006329 [Puccinia striiformis f. sp. tritici]|uniref:Uncharacterized protein n=1 Tax=Puccinia striiformis f. sp. tritici TaxID=168172 RepID=A0ACC0EIU6_9BASI|nr:hypothetical protein MJO28_006329 [Puccinia striiformis f. sp. tritici]